MSAPKTIIPVGHSYKCQTQRRSLEQENASDFECSCCPVGRSGHRIAVTEDSVYSLGGFNPTFGHGGYQDNMPPLEQDERGFPLFQERLNRVENVLALRIEQL
ncbi:hypothetical protein RRG08_013665 [Elysia crispata]|uniref:Uncharacterized protein n=1 Tax=Elysia crispata TaxID=231223 RepID=A0AAE1A270_9GAST|nr:hypothetical protein RRG08_013665 [Elysia crispata]